MGAPGKSILISFLIILRTRTWRNDQCLMERDRIITHNEKLKWHDPLNLKQEEDENSKHNFIEN